MTHRRQRFAKIHTHLADNSFSRRPSAGMSVWSRYCLGVDSWIGIVVRIGWWIWIVGAACQESHKTTENAAPTVQKDQERIYLHDDDAKTTIAETKSPKKLAEKTTRSTIPIPSDTLTATAEPATTLMVETDGFSSVYDPDERFLSAFRLIFCAQKRGDQESVFRVWDQFGYTSASWADAVQGAVKRAATDMQLFRYRWAEIRRVPCP